MSLKETPIGTPEADPELKADIGSRRTTRRQEIRSALLAVPAVLTMTTAAWADTVKVTSAGGYVSYVQQ